MKLCAVLVVAPLLLAVVVYGSILDDYLYTYRNILYKFEEEREERRNTTALALDRHDFVVSVESIERLLAMHDDDSKCSVACQAVLIRYISNNGLPFHTLEKIIRDIYGDEISDDPYVPQEIHLALHAENTSMNVMWVTMDELEKPLYSS